MNNETIDSIVQEVMDRQMKLFLEKQHEINTLKAQLNYHEQFGQKQTNAVRTLEDNNKLLIDELRISKMNIKSCTNCVKNKEQVDNVMDDMDSLKSFAHHNGMAWDSWCESNGVDEKLIYKYEIGHIHFKPPTEEEKKNDYKDGCNHDGMICEFKTTHEAAAARYDKIGDIHPPWSYASHIQNTQQSGEGEGIEYD